jgi:hypothetical protein
MHGERKVPGRSEAVEVLLQLDSIGTQIDKLASIRQAIDNLLDLRMKQWLTAGNRDNRRTTLFDRCKALCRRQLPAQNMSRMLNLPTTRTCQIASQQWLEHEHQRIPFHPAQTLSDDVPRNRPGLGKRNGHEIPFGLAILTVSVRQTGPSYRRIHLAAHAKTRTDQACTAARILPSAMSGK